MIKQTDLVLRLYLNFKEKAEIQGPAGGHVDLASILGLTLSGEGQREKN